jgi:hypothetical protein
MAVVFVAASAPSAAAEPNTSADIDLGALGLDPSSSGFDDHLNIYGFADINWQKLRWSKPNMYLANTTSFVFGNLNIYLAKNLTPKARSLVELRFLFAPNGSQNADGSVVDTTAQDLSDFQRTLQWGGIVIERAYVEYDVHPLLTLRAGHWLTPYGIWNTDHGSPAIIGTIRPFIIGEQFFPEHQTGLDAFGSISLGDYKLGYHATLSNGRSSTEAQADFDNEPAYGGRLELHTPWALTVGASIYGGGDTESIQGVTATSEEIAYGADAQWDRGGLHVQGELIARHRKYDDTTAPQFATLDPSSLVTGTDLGSYLLAGYRFDRLWNVMPFAFYEFYNPRYSTNYDAVNAINLGVNFRPAPALVFKVQLTLPVFRGDDLDLLAGQRLQLVTTQAAWVF